MIGKREIHDVLKPVAKIIASTWTSFPSGSMKPFAVNSEREAPQYVETFGEVIASR